ncbi:MAG: hypothetical protein ABI867_34120 [Kofleriaceae bacterium]
MTKNLLPLSFILVVACGDNTTPPAADSGSDDPPADVERAVVVSGTFAPGEPGVMSTLDIESLTMTTQVAPNGAIAEDPMIRRFGNELFVVNRAGGNNVTILDAKTFVVKEQLATGAGSNPQDVAVLADKLYVPAFGTAGVVVVTRGSTETTTIDLSSLDPDGQPNCISAFRVLNDVYVACELLDASFAARGPGKIAVIDTLTDTMRATITLTNKNPFGVFEQMPEDQGGDLVIPTVPNFGNLNLGCVERIKTGSAPVKNGCAITNLELGGNYVSRIDFATVAGMPIMWMIASNGQFGPAARSALKAWDLEGKSLWPTLSPETELLVDAVACPGGKVIVADQTTASNGLRVYSDTSEISTAPIAIGLSPNSSHGLVCY